LNNLFTIDEIKKEKGEDNFNYIKEEFLKEYDEINNLKLPSDYKFIHKPNLMQLLTTYRLIKNKFYANWSGTGSGKTLSAILSGRIANIKNTLIICNNATVEGWEKSINSYFNNNNIITDINNLDIDNNKFNYIIINYEKFQQKNSVELVNQLLTLNIDYIILDEVQNVKQREDDNCSIRKRNINNLRLGLQHLNNELLTLVMTATPVINNLVEAKYLIELLTGVEHSELETQPTIENGIKIYETLTRYGLRYIPQYNILVNEEIIKINGEHLSDKIINIHRGDYIGFEKSLLKTKLISVKDKIKKGTLIYTHYVTELKDIIGDYVSKLGLTYGYYTGDNKDGLELFKNGEIDVLIGSSPIGTGIDGIQNVCNTLIPICLPWTNSEYEQLKGRLIRQGSLFDNVNIYIPQVFIEKNEEEEWNYDNNRLNIIKYKGTLADLAVDGIVPKGKLPTKEKLIQDAQKELSNWLKEIEITV
jgi:superfamily II DNA or RNA helicase